MAARLSLCFSLAVLLCVVYRQFSVEAATNCHTGSQCSEAPRGYFQTLIDLDPNSPALFIKVCCPGANSKYFGAGSLPKPWCRCVFEDVVTTSCWKGEQCCDCPDDKVGKVNGMPVCCPNCLGTFLASNTSCVCV